MKKLLIALSFALISQHANAFVAGRMTCVQYGTIAQGIWIGKQNGRTLKQQLATVKKFPPGIERKNLQDIAKTIYKPFMSKLSKQGAYDTFWGLCQD